MVININKYHPALAVLTLLILMVVSLSLLTFFEHSKEPPEPLADPDTFSPYGEFLTWTEVDKLFPRYAEATVIDFDTGSKFRVQRKGGTYHADVQPLTAEDTAVMKLIYSGKWSWQRRAVIVQLDSGRRIAASINGMPHGLGSIPDNNFSGHSCIHFRDSKTHCSREVNMAHQIMVWKAANQVDQQVLALTPQKTVEMFLAAVDQGDTSIASKVVDKDSEAAAELLQGLMDIESVKLHRIGKMEQGSLAVCIGVIYKNSREIHEKNLTLQLSQRKNQGWLIDPQTMLPLLDSVSTCC
ncbi:MAG: hypothetical protein AB1815_12995 [Bacillota bacterium]